MAVQIYIKGASLILENFEDGKKSLSLNPSNCRYYVKEDNQFYLLDHIEKTLYKLGGFNNIADEYGNVFASESSVRNYLDNIVYAHPIINNATPEKPFLVNHDEIGIQDIDMEASDFTGWEGNPKDLFGNVNDGGIINTSTDIPKVIILRLIRTRKMRDLGIGASTGNFSNLKATLLGSGESERGILDLSQDDSKEKSIIYSQEAFGFNGIKLEFFTSDTVTITNLFFKYTFSTRKQSFVLKFGRNPQIDSGQTETVCGLGDNYIFTTIAQPYFISSSNINDTQTIKGELLLLTPDNRYLQYFFEVNLQGQTKVQIPTFNNLPVIAINRAFNVSADYLLGNVYIYEDTAIVLGVPQDLAKVKGYIEIGREQTEQAVYTVPEYLENGQKVVFAELYKYSGSIINDKISAAGRLDLRVAERGQTAKIKDAKALNNNFTALQNYGEDTPLVIQPGSDVYVEATSFSTNDIEVEADFIINPIPL